MYVSQREGTRKALCTPRPRQAWTDQVNSMRTASKRKFRHEVVCSAGIFSLLFSLSSAISAQNMPARMRIDATVPAPATETGFLHLGGVSPTGHRVEVNSQYLTYDGKPWLPVMGEFHFSRFPQKYWEEEILKMKAGGVQIVATYVFWIHHEEVEGQFDWTGQRDLRDFVSLCARHGLYVYLRIGPWDHGEARNGGFQTGSSKRRFLCAATTRIFEICGRCTDRLAARSKASLERRRSHPRRTTGKRV